ncbi:hypothetical protein [Streptomyces sp. URMC 129]|uniref:hypothetical protein n=1 Tax=Streptomyces sp. URMC 129 TaxID=3423407 RepID=UPI003F1DD0E9
MSILPSHLPLPLSARTGRASETYTPEGIAYDVAIGGMPFLLAITPDRPLTRELAQIRKEQIDQQEIPGEQSLADWWLRSQSTFIGGAGLLYQDPDASNQYAIQYGTSTGLNPWVNGKLTLLKATSQDIADGSANAHYVLGWNDGTDRYWSAVGTALKSSTGSASTTITWGGSGTILALASDGTRYFAADSTGVYSGTGTGAGSLLWNTGSSNVSMGWVKGRLIAGIGASVYELVGTGPTLPSAKFTHLNSSWRWSAVAEGTNAIYVAGYAGSQSAIYKFILDTDGAVPTLASGGIQTAQLPLGETVLSMTTYLGSYVGIGTSRGFRVGEIDDNGDIAYGPLLFENSSGVRSVAGYDRFFFVAATNAISSRSGLYRVDLGQPIANEGVTPSLRYAYATDLQAHVTGTVDSVTLLGNSSRMVFTVRGQGSYLEHATSLESTGTFVTGRVRYNTLTGKLFKFLTLRTPASLSGSLTASVIDPGGGETTVITVTGGAEAENVLLQSPATAAEWLQLKLTFTRDGSNAALGPEVNGWQFKALPGELRQRIFQLPLSCFDFEQDRSGQQVGYEGRTLARLEQFETMAQRGDGVTYQDLASGYSYLVLVDEYEFRQTSPPGDNNAAYGGYLYVRLRTIADVVSS